MPFAAKNLEHLRRLQPPRRTDHAQCPPPLKPLCRFAFSLRLEHNGPPAKARFFHCAWDTS